MSVTGFAFGAGSFYWQIKIASGDFYLAAALKALFQRGRSNREWI
jgi:hypothetical protein